MMLAELARIWGYYKLRIEDYLGLSADAVHVHIGVLLLIFFALAMHRALDHWLPWCLVLLTEGANEFIDMHQRAGSPESNWPASQHDILNTMFLPTLLLIFIRLRRRFGGRVVRG